MRKGTFLVLLLIISMGMGASGKAGITAEQIKGKLQPELVVSGRYYLEPLETVIEKALTALDLKVPGDSSIFRTAWKVFPEDRVIPNDPFFKHQLSFLNPGGKLTIPTYSHKTSEHAYEALQGIDPEITHAWSITTGKKDIIAAFLDDGFFYNHEDVKDNIWKKSGETGLDKNGFPKETNGIDDDGNGYAGW